MAGILLLLSISLVSLTLDLTIFSAEFASSLQNFCQGLFPESPFRHAYSAMVCGTNLPAHEMKWALQQTGLLHLFVVSGSHLVFLSLLLDFTFLPLQNRWTFLSRTWIKRAIAIVLIAYAFLTGFNPPVVRSLVTIGVRELNSGQKLFWNSFTEVFYAGLFCLTLFPTWWLSLSFMLSWLAGLGLCLGGNGFQKALWIYCLLLLPLAGMGLTDPYSILLNWFLAPVLGLTLFPMSLLVWMFHPFVTWGDWIWNHVLRGLVALASYVSPSTTLNSVSIIWLWIFTLGLHVGLSLRRTLRRRKELCL